MYKYIFSDFDGTLTEKGGRLGSTFNEIIDIVQKEKSELIIVSGRSVSWGHFFLTHFPLRYAIMEGGGVILEKTENGTILEELLVSDEDMIALNEFTFKLAKTKIRDFISADSYGRKTDQALELYSMSDEEKNLAFSLLKEDEVNFCASNVHLNYWIGDVSKSKASIYFLKKYIKENTLVNSIYFGDALNDESMFECFPNCVGVSNISQYLDQMSFRPKIILEGEENAYAAGVKNFLKNNC